MDGVKWHWNARPISINTGINIYLPECRQSQMRFSAQVLRKIEFQTHLCKQDFQRPEAKKLVSVQESHISLTFWCRKTLLLAWPFVMSSRCIKLLLWMRPWHLKSMACFHYYYFFLFNCPLYLLSQERRNYFKVHRNRYLFRSSNTKLSRKSIELKRRRVIIIVLWFLLSLLSNEIE